MARITVPTPNIKVGEVGFTSLDLLNRAETGRSLSDIVERIDEPLVIAIDGRWGSGKSFFLKCWTGAHTIENGGKARVIYFDAFESDYLTDPLVALVSCIDRHLEPTPQQEHALAKLKGAAARLWRPAARIALAGATGGATEMVGPVLDSVLSAASSEAEKALDRVWAEAEGQHQAMKRFRAALEELTASGEDGQPRKLVLVVDELDRCRPDYALSLLEMAKHFFSVPNVHFVLGANLLELQNSVQARYGSGIAALRYLQKFISLTITLPDVQDDSQQSSIALRYLEQVGPSVGLNANAFEMLSDQLRLRGLQEIITLRDVDRILSYVMLIPSGPESLDTRRPGYALVLLGLIILKVTRPMLYIKAREGVLRKDEVFSILFAADDVHKDEGFAWYVSQAWLAFVLSPDALDPEAKNQLFGGRIFRGASPLREFVRTHLETVRLGPSPV